LRLHPSESEASSTLSPEWEDLHDELLKRLATCDRYLRTQSTYSAREEIREALLLLTRRLDQLMKPTNTSDSSRKPAIRKSTPHASALQHALRALDEAPFESDDDLAETLQTFSDLIPQAILQHPWAADLLYALGKSYERETEIDVAKSDTLRLQAIACYQAALRVAPSRPYISNQLGFNHLFNNSLDQAFNALQRSLDAGPSIHAWRNLAELYRRRGDHREALLADKQAQYLLDQSVQAIEP
jgi:tetratricopeptide (TPR) repeat protein